MMPHPLKRGPIRYYYMIYRSYFDGFYRSDLFGRADIAP
jgi:hypothetical protein